MNELFPVVILAGGLATRLRPVTETIPKSLVEVAGEPFIIHQLRLLKKQGIKRIVMCIGYLGEMIENRIGDGKQFNLSISYSYDGPSLLGTAGAIKKALPLLEDHFFVLYGDSYLPCSFNAVQHFFLTQPKKALMTVYKNNGQWDKSNVQFTHPEILIYDKKNQTPEMHYIDYGLGVLSKNAFELVPENEPYDLASLYQNLLMQNQLAGFEVFERFYETGSFAGMKELGYYLQQENRETVF